MHQTRFGASRDDEASLIERWREWRNRPRPIRDAVEENRPRNRVRMFRDVVDTMRAQGVPDPFRAAVEFMRDNQPPSVRDAVGQRFGAGQPASPPLGGAAAGGAPQSGGSGAAAARSGPAASSRTGYLAFGSGLGGGAEPEVAALQTMLVAAGAPIDVDGRFGPQTELALYRFQKQRGIDVDGVAGPQTMKALTETIAAAARRDQALGAAQQARVAAPGDPRDRRSRDGGPHLPPPHSKPSPPPMKPGGASTFPGKV